MKESVNIFCEIPCLTESSTPLSAAYLHKKWFKNGDRRILAQYLQKFIYYNQNCFNFLNITPTLEGSDQNIRISFKTSQYIGAIPLKSSVSGKQIGDLIIKPRFYSDNNYIELLDYLGNDINPEYFDGLPLVSGRNFRPPLYLEAIKFIRSLEILVKQKWVKFANFEKNLTYPSGVVNWNKYAINSYDPKFTTIFPTKLNILNESHYEYEQLKYVYEKCKEEIKSINTPERIKLTIKEVLINLDAKMYRLNSKFVNKFTIRNADIPIVKKTKEIGNSFLASNISNSLGWRLDFSVIFERYIQKIFLDVGKKTGFISYPNIRFSGNGSSNLEWTIRYLEPDLVLKKNDFSIYIDAKYKSHLLNKQSKSLYLHEDHRNDLHQLFSYCSFDKNIKKTGILCYPSNSLECFKRTYSNNIDNNTNTVLLIGIPLNIESLSSIHQFLSKILVGLYQ